MEHEDAEVLTSFLVPMMHYYPDTRATAAELLKHPWLEGVVVQGEIDMAERVHRLEVDRIRAQAVADAKGKEKAPPVSIDEVAQLGPSVKGLVGMGRI